MKTVLVRYHREADSYWADSPDVDGFVAVGATLGEVRSLAKEGLAVYLEEEEDAFEVVEQGPGRDGVTVVVRVDEQASVTVSTRSLAASTASGPSVRPATWQPMAAGYYGVHSGSHAVKPLATA